MMQAERQKVTKNNLMCSSKYFKKITCMFLRVYIVVDTLIKWLSLLGLLLWVEATANRVLYPTLSSSQPSTSFWSSLSSHRPSLTGLSGSSSRRPSHQHHSDVLTEVFIWLKAPRNMVSHQHWLLTWWCGPTFWWCSLSCRKWTPVGGRGSTWRRPPPWCGRCTSPGTGWSRFWSTDKQEVMMGMRIRKREEGAVLYILAGYFCDHRLACGDTLWQLMVLSQYSSWPSALVTWPRGRPLAQWLAGSLGT